MSEPVLVEIITTAEAIVKERWVVRCTEAELAEAVAADHVLSLLDEGDVVSVDNVDVTDEQDRVLVRFERQK